MRCNCTHCCEQKESIERLKKKKYKLYRVQEVRTLYVYAKSSKDAKEIAKEAEYNPAENRILRPTLATRKQLFKDQWNDSNPYCDDEVINEIDCCEELV